MPRPVRLAERGDGLVVVTLRSATAAAGAAIEAGATTDAIAAGDTTAVAALLHAHSGSSRRPRR